MSTIQELASIEAGEMAEAKRAYEEGVANEAAGRSVNVPRLRDAMKLLDLNATDFSNAVDEKRQLARDIAIAGTYAGLCERHKLAAVAASDHDKEVERYNAAAKLEADRLNGEVAALGREVNRVGTIRNRLIAGGVIASD